MNKLPEWTFLRHLLLFACLMGANGAFAGGDKPKTPAKVPSTITEGDKPKTVSHPIAQTVAGVTSVNVAASSVQKLQNVQLSNALDQMGDAMALIDYSAFPAERAEALIPPPNRSRQKRSPNAF